MLIFLFGNTVQLDFPTEDYVDVSNLRPVPDNQEIIMDMKTGFTVIVEFVEYQQGVPDQEIAKFHFSELDRLNDAIHSEIKKEFQIYNFECLVGEQQLKDKKVQMLLGVHRLEQFHSEVLISIFFGTIKSEQEMKEEYEIGKSVLKTFKILNFGIFPTSDTTNK